MPKVSVCVPSYNQIDQLKKTIDSVLCQSYRDYEIVITDDSPGTIVKDFVEQYNLPEKIKYFKNISKLGSPENWNECIRKAKGEYIKILHHDDWLNFNDSLEKYVQLLDDNPEANFAFSATQGIGQAGREWVHEITGIQLQAIQENPLLLFNNNIIGAPSITIVRRNPELHFAPNLKWLVDIEYYIRQLSENKKFVYSTEALAVTFMMKGRVSDQCQDNKDVEVSEYLYLLNTIQLSLYRYSNSAVRKCLLQTINICRKYQVNSVKEVRKCGYSGTIQPVMKTYFVIQTFSSRLASLYLRIVR